MISHLSFPRMRGFGLGAPRVSAAERRSKQRAAQAQRQAQAAAKHEAQRAAQAQRKASATAQHEANKQAAAKRKADAQAKHAATQATRQQNQQQHKAVQQQKKADRQAKREAKRRMRVAGKTVDIPESEIPKVKALEGTLNKLKSDVANAAVALKAKRARRRKRPARMHGLGEDYLPMDGSAPSYGGLTDPNAIDPNTGLPYQQADPAYPATPADPGTFIMPPTPTMPAPTGYEKRKAKGRLRPIDMIYELSAATQAQLAFLINEIISLQRQLMSMLAELNAPDYEYVDDPNAIDPNTGLPYQQVDPTTGLPSQAQYAVPQQPWYLPPTMSPYYQDPSFFAPPPPPAGYYTESPMAPAGYGPSLSPYGGDASTPLVSDPFDMIMPDSGSTNADYAPSGYGLTPLPTFEDPTIDSPAPVSEFDLFSEQEPAMQAPPPPAMEFPAEMAPPPSYGSDQPDYGTIDDGFFGDGDFFSGSLFGLDCGKDCGCGMK